MRHVYSAGVAFLMQYGLDLALPASTPRIWVISLAGAAGMMWSWFDAWLTRTPQEMETQL